MQIQHIDATFTTSQTPQEGQIQIATNELTELLLPCIGTSGVWDTWLTPLSYLPQSAVIEHLEVLPMPEDASHVSLKILLQEPDVSIKVRIYILSQ